MEWNRLDLARQMKRTRDHCTCDWAKCWIHMKIHFEQCSTLMCIYASNDDTVNRTVLRFSNSSSIACAIHRRNNVTAAKWRAFVIQTSLSLKFLIIDLFSWSVTYGCAYTAGACPSHSKYDSLRFIFSLSIFSGKSNVYLCNGKCICEMLNKDK